MIRLVPTEQVNAWWPRVLPFLLPAIERGGRATPDEVLKWLIRGDYQLWICGDIKGAMTTAISEYPGSHWLTVVHCGGRDLSSWVSGVNQLTDFAKARACVGIEGIGRKGWKRMLPGFTERGVLFEKVFK